MLSLTGCVSIYDADGIGKRTTIHPICGWTMWGNSDYLNEIDILYIPVYKDESPIYNELPIYYQND